MVSINRKVAVKDFYGPGRCIYEDELGFRESEKSEARSYDPKEIFLYETDEIGNQIVFYRLSDGLFYAIDPQTTPAEVKILPKHPNRSPFIGFQCEHDADAEGEVIATYDTMEEMWDNLRIDGLTLEEILRESYLTHIN